MFPVPAVALTASDYPRLKKLARVAANDGNMDAMLLLVEINRAEIIPDDARDVESIVTMGSWVTYLADWGVPRKTVQLVWPEDRTSDQAQIFVLSGLGAALVDLQVGDQMPYFVAGCMNVVRVERVNRCRPDVDFAGPRPRPPAFATNDDNDPGPTAA